MMESRTMKFMNMAIALSLHGMRENRGGPFGAIVVKGDQVIGKGCNMVLSSNDPTAHAEIVAIREACKFLDHSQLEGCEIYTSCEPCPMCLGAIYWSRPDRIYYANSRKDAASIGFDDSMIYDEIGKDLTTRKIPMIHIKTETAWQAFQEWQGKPDRKQY